MSGETDLQKLISTMTPALSEQEFVFTTLKNATLAQLGALEPLCTFKESEGMSVILAQQQADQQGIVYSGTFRCITLSVHSSLDAVGLTAAVSTKLTNENISANVVSAYFHDHIFVASQDANRALAALIELADTHS